MKNKLLIRFSYIIILFIFAICSGCELPGSSSSDTNTNSGTGSTGGSGGTMGGTGGTNGNLPMAQVVNNSDKGIYQVTIGNIVFTQNLGVNGGNSTGFIEISEGMNSVVIYPMAASFPIMVGSLGSFLRGNSYAVNIRNSGSGYSAELWQRLNTGSTFNSDRTKIFIAAITGGEAETIETTGATGGVDTSAITSSIYSNPSVFGSAAAAAGLGTPTVIDFEDVPACTGNTIEGGSPFNGNFYSHRGVVFSNPNNYAFYIAPGGLFWNDSKSLSVGRFPNDPKFPKSPEYEDDSFVITFDTPKKAVGLESIDGGRDVQFRDINGAVISTWNFQTYAAYRGFVGMVSPNNPIKSVNIIDLANDGDDVNYDNITFYSGN